MARAPRVLVACMAIAAFAFVGGSAWSEEPASESSADVSAAPPLYQLPKVGKPTGRVGGGRRGETAALPDVYAIVPDHVAYTTSSQPTLYWYVSDQAKGDVHFELTLIDESSIDPILDRRFAVPAKPGLQQVRLADHGVSLAPGQEYQWSISLVPDGNDRSKDLVSSGWIEVVEAPSGLAERVSSAGPSGAARVYGEEGLWYEMLDATLTRVDAGDADARRQLASLLTQVGLPEDAAARP